MAILVHGQRVEEGRERGGGLEVVRPNAIVVVIHCYILSAQDFVYFWRSCGEHSTGGGGRSEVKWDGQIVSIHLGSILGV